MVGSVTFDPAMVIYLDSQNNRAGKPNENYARELLELFTLGEGHYSEDDIKGAALALTGISINRRSGDVRILPRRHSRDEKHFLASEAILDPKRLLILFWPSLVRRSIWSKNSGESLSLHTRSAQRWSAWQHCLETVIMNFDH